jgi:hypothetical protein
VSIIKYVDATIITIKYVISNTSDVLDIGFFGMTNILTIPWLLVGSPLSLGEAV